MYRFPLRIIVLIGLTLSLASVSSTRAGDSSAQVLGFDLGDWKGIELSSEQVKTGGKSGLWKDHLVNKSVGSGNIPHDWSDAEELSLWIYNAGQKPVPLMIVLVSRTAPQGFSYFGYRMTVERQGWNEVRVPLSYFQPSGNPAGWQKIDSVMFAADGWGMKPSPDAVLYLDGLVLHRAVSKPLSEWEQKELDQIKRQFAEYQQVQWKGGGEMERQQERVPGWMATLNADGAWPDIDYSGRAGGFWQPLTHLARLKAMALAYTTPGSSLKGDAALAEAVQKALGNWLRNDYWSSAWWYREIGVPAELSKIMLLMDAGLTREERSAGIRIVGRAVMDSPPHWGRGVLTGQNRVWVAANALAKGLLASDLALVRRARDVVFEEVVIASQPGGTKPVFKTSGKPGDIDVSTQEGVQPDFSFYQHGPLLQLGNYGMGFAQDTVQWITVLRGTSLAASPEKMAVVSGYLLDGLATVVWKGSVDISSCGRQIGPQSPAGKGGEVLLLLDTAKTMDPEHAAQYQAAIERDRPGATAIPAQNKYFWRSDYMVHRRPEYYTSTRMNSARVLASEVVNTENLSGGYLGDGATFLYLTGREYEDIFPVWDWARLPGVTAPVTTDKARLKPRNWKVTNDCDFVGGVSDGGYGAAVLTLNRDGLEAKKSWFYFDDEIVNLGAGISSDREPVVSSVNQCLATGEVMVAAGEANPGNADGGVREYTDLKWAWHDGVGYVFPSPQRVSLGVQEQTGAWNLVNGRAKPDPVKAPVFSAWINHGDKPRDATYEYLLLPGASREQTGAAAASPKIQILQNTRELQAVRHAGSRRVHAVFHQPGALSFGEGRSITVDRPCVLMLEEPKGRLTIADPTQLLKEITVTLDGKETKLVLPAGAMAGSSLAVVLP